MAPASLFLCPKVRNRLAGLLGVEPEQLRTKVLYQAKTKDEFNVNAFHGSCDNQGPTFTLIRRAGAEEHVCGGFTKAGWCSTGPWVHDPTAFLFTFSTSENAKPPNKYRHLNGGKDAIYAHPTYGPAFNSDLVVWSNGIWEIRSSRVSYDIPPATQFFGCADRPSADAEVEVIGVWAPGFSGDASTYELAPRSAPACDIGWDKQAYAALAAFLTDYQPPAGLPRANILLVGGVGAGKSSIISSVDSLFKGRISRRAPHGLGTGSFTSLLRKYAFQVDNPDAGTSRTLAWSLWDSPGWSYNDYNAGELGFILDGNLPDRFDFSGKINMQSPEFRSSPKVADRVHCVLFVVPCRFATDAVHMKRLNNLKRIARMRGIPTLVILTKVDAYDPCTVGEDITKTFQSASLMRLREEVQELAGMGGSEDVFPIKSFTHEYEPQYQAGVLLFQALKHALNAATDFITELPGVSDDD